MAEIAESIFLTVRAAHARAVATTGLGPKRFLRIARLLSALALAGRPGASWSAVAYAAGCADQSHLVRELRALLGDAPGTW